MVILNRKRIAQIIIAVMVVAFTASSADLVEAADEPLFQPNPPKVNDSYNGKNAGKIPVLTYHRLASDREKKYAVNRNTSLVISKSKFAAQMKYLHDKGYRTVSMEEFYLWHRGKIKLPKKTVLITFDDGCYSVIKYALPILKKYNMRATIFIIGSRTGAVTKTDPVKKGRYGYIGTDVMKSVSRSYPGFEFQNHTYNMHYRKKGKTAVNHLSSARQKEDLRNMYDRYRFTYMAYPYGSYNRKTVKAAKANRIKLAFTYGHNRYARRSDNVYAVERIKISAGMPMSTFKRWVKGNH